MDNIYNSHYIRTDSQHRIIEGWSDGPNPERDTTGAICINDRGGYQFRIFGKENPAIINEDGAHLFKYIDGEVQATTEEERSAEIVPDLAFAKSNKIIESKQALARYLEANPLLYTDGNYYSVTAEKQSLLTSALTTYQLAMVAGATIDLRWNATGQECTIWEFNDLSALALSIAAYVTPLVAHQQYIETQIQACKTVEEINDIEITYGASI